MKWAVVQALSAVALPGVVIAQQTGQVTGQVTDVATGAPVPGVQLSVVGTTLGTMTNEQGRFTLRNLPARALTVRVLRVGYEEQRLPVTVAAGGTATLDVRVKPAALTLTPVVTTVTGTQLRTEQPNAISSIAASKVVETAPITNVGELLGTRAAGVTVTLNNVTGSAPRIRIRGNSSLSLSNAPIYFIDGVRMASGTGQQQISVGGSVAGRLNDINPEEIENIEVVKGPSAATLYGTDAANGVILITTKKGRAGRVQTTAWAEGGTVTQASQFPTAYSTWGRPATNPTATSGFSASCNLRTVTAGTCLRDSVTSYNLFEDKDVTPFGTGTRGTVGAQVSGGSEAVRFFTSAEREREVGSFRLPGFERRLAQANGVDIPDEQERPNAYAKTNLRVNVNSAPSSKIDLGVNAGYAQVYQRLTVADNNTFGVFSHAYGGPGSRTQVANGLAGNTTPLNGYRALTPGEIYRFLNSQNVNRFTGSSNVAYRPTSWLAARANLGLDFSSTQEQSLCRRNACAGSVTRLQGAANYGSTQWATYTVDLGTTATFNPLPWLNSRSSVGAQYVRIDLNQNLAGSTQLPTGASTVTSGAVPSATEATTLTRTAGAYVDQQLGFADRLFLTVGVRTDQNSAFGTDFKRVFYPKTGVSYVISQEPIFPKFAWLDQLRLRATYGQSGVQPGPNDAQRTFISTTVSVDRVDQAGVAFSALGNTNLRPERAAEFESGIDANLLNNRLTVEATYYNKLNTDQLISRVIAPSVGAGARTQRENLASVRNSGFEALVNARLLDRARLGWDMTLNGSTNTNRIVSLGGVPFPTTGTLQQRVGYPLNSWFERPYRYTDTNNDRVIVPSEITVDTGYQFLGYSLPRYELAWTNGFDLVNKRLRLTTLFDYKGGYKIENVTEEFRCSSRSNCQALHDPNAPLAEQARAVAQSALGSNNTYHGYIEDGSFVRWRELALTFNPGEAFARRFLRTRSLSVTASMRNLALWSKYSGIDPEMNYGTADVQNEFQTSPPQRYTTLRVNLGF